jgi:conjugal transfer pilus assembly protein TraB
MANTLLAGLISGFGQALALTGQQQNTTINGAVTSTVTNPWTTGFGAGVSKSFNTVADYWTKMAEKIFPVVSVESGTVVDVVFSRGTTIETTTK